MCFEQNSDWTAEVYMKYDRPLTDTNSPLQCGECLRWMQVGSTYQTEFLQQYECCQVCGNTSLGCDCEDRDFGIMEYFRTCSDCLMLTEAISSVEIKLGCSKQEATPNRGDLLEEMSEINKDDFEKYVSRAEELHPELVKNGYLSWLRTKAGKE